VQDDIPVALTTVRQCSVPYLTVLYCGESASFGLRTGGVRVCHSSVTSVRHLTVSGIMTIVDSVAFSLVQ
jgi:hypothetical protein